MNVTPEPNSTSDKTIGPLETANEPPEGWPRWTAYMLGSLGLGGIGGLIFEWITMPLPWMIGPMVFATAAALAKAPVRGSKRIRSVVIPVLGVMLGSSFTPDTINYVSTWIPSIILMLVFVAIIIAVVAAYLESEPYRRDGRQFHFFRACDFLSMR